MHPIDFETAMAAYWAAASGTSATTLYFGKASGNPVPPYAVANSPISGLAGRSTGADYLNQIIYVKLYQINQYAVGTLAKSVSQMSPLGLNRAKIGDGLFLLIEDYGGAIEEADRLWRWMLRLRVLNRIGT